MLNFILNNCPCASVFVETTAKPPNGETWMTLENIPCPVDRVGWEDERNKQSLPRADSDISPSAVDDLECIVVRAENPRCLLYRGKSDKYVETS